MGNPGKTAGRQRRKEEEGWIKGRLVSREGEEPDKRGGARVNSQKKAVLPLQFQADGLIIYVLRMFMTRVKMA